VRGAEIRKIASRGKSVLVDRTCIGERSRGAVRIIRGTKLPVYRARNPTGDTVAAAGPGPSHCIACRDVECVWHKRETLPHRHVKNLARSRWRNVGDWLSVVIDNLDRLNRPGRRGWMPARRRA
jgi:hypothetical protein